MGNQSVLNVFVCLILNNLGILDMVVYIEVQTVCHLNQKQESYKLFKIDKNSNFLMNPKWCCLTTNVRTILSLLMCLFDVF